MHRCLGCYRGKSGEDTVNNCDVQQEFDTSSATQCSHIPAHTKFAPILRVFAGDKFACNVVLILEQKADFGGKFAVSVHDNFCGPRVSLKPFHLEIIGYLVRANFVVAFWSDVTGRLLVGKNCIPVTSSFSY